MSATEAKTMTLNDYVNDRESVVLFWAGVGCPAGDYTVLGHPDLDFAERRGLLDLSGTVDAEGDWRWDGEGDPLDDQGNTIYKLHAYADTTRWEEMAEEFENGN